MLLFSPETVALYLLLLLTTDQRLEQRLLRAAVMHLFSLFIFRVSISCSVSPLKAEQWCSWLRREAALQVLNVLLGFSLKRFCILPTFFLRMHKHTHHCPIKYSEESLCQELDISLYRREAPTTLLVSSSSLVLFFLFLHCMNCSLMYSHYFGSALPLGLPQCEGSTHTHHTFLHKKTLEATLHSSLKRAPIDFPLLNIKCFVPC